MNMNKNKNKNMKLHIYGDYEIDLNKYPRKNSDKEITDIILIIFLTHESFLKKLAESFDNAIKYHNECKEYYYTLKFNKESRNYSAQDILFLIREIPTFENPMNFIKNLPYLDQIYFFYIKNKDFYLNIYSSIEKAKKAYFERRDYTHKISVPKDFYGQNMAYQNNYSALELMEINAYTQYLISRKIIKELPIPKSLF